MHLFSSNSYLRSVKLFCTAILVKLRIFYFPFTLLTLNGCYGENSKTSQIGNLNTRCLSKNAWDSICKEYSTIKTTDSVFINKINGIKAHFIKPKYILYFDSGPKELIGCDYYSVRAVYNPEINDDVLDGLSVQLNDDEQVRIRNRVQNALLKYQCAEGKAESRQSMKEPAIFSKEYYDKK